MTVNPYPTDAPKVVPALTDVFRRSLGWQHTGLTGTVPPMQGQSLGKRVAQLRKARGWSAEALAYRAGVSSKTINRIESGGVTDPRRNTIQPIADALEVDLFALIGEPESPEGVPLSAQVEAVAVEFREDVDLIRTELAAIHAQLETAISERQTLREEIAAQQKLLESQSGLIEEIRELVAVLQDIKHVQQVAGAAAEATVRRMLPAPPAGPEASQPQPRRAKRTG